MNNPICFKHYFPNKGFQIFNHRLTAAKLSQIYNGEKSLYDMGNIIMICQYCNQKAEKVSGAEIFPKWKHLHTEQFWLCRLCEAWVGIYTDGTPKGILANESLRSLRRQAQTAFDNLWTGIAINKVDISPPHPEQFTSRDAALHWLQEEQKINGFYTENFLYWGDLPSMHIGQMNEKGLKEIIYMMDKRNHSRFAPDILAIFEDWELTLKVKSNEDDYQDIPFD